MEPTTNEVEAARVLTQAFVAWMTAFQEGIIRRSGEDRRRDLNRTDAPIPAVRRGRNTEVPPMLLDSAEAARQLSISKGTLFNWSAPRGPIPTVKVGARVCYDRKDLEAAIDRMKIRKVPAPSDQRDASGSV